MDEFIQSFVRSFIHLFIFVQWMSLCAIQIHMQCDVRTLCMCQCPAANERNWSWMFIINTCSYTQGESERGSRRATPLSHTQRDTVSKGRKRGGRGKYYFLSQIVNHFLFSHWFPNRLKSLYFLLPSFMNEWMEWIRDYEHAPYVDDDVTKGKYPNKPILFVGFKKSENTLDTQPHNRHLIVNQ